MSVTVAIAGAGKGSGAFSANLGARVARALLARGAIVKPLVRAESTRPDDLDGAQFVTIDYNKPETLEKALQGVDVVVSCLSDLSGPALACQPPLARAAKKAGVKLFVPSEFGTRTPDEYQAGGPVSAKADLQKEMRDLGLPYALIWNGPFANFIPAMVTPKEGKLTLVGDGNALISFTSLNSVANYLGHILTAYPPEELGNKAFPIEDFRTTFNDLVQHAKKAHPNMKIDYEPIEVARKRWNDEHDWLAYLQAEWASGGGLVAPLDELKNDLYPGWEKVTVESIFQQ